MKNKYFYILCIGLLASSCLQEETIPPEKVIQYKKAIIRSRNVISVNRNIDVNNPLEISFVKGFENQLVEVELEASDMSTAEYTVLSHNGDLELKQRSASTFYGSLEFFLNGQNITTCLISQCVASQCSNFPAHNLKGKFNNRRLYLNLSKLAVDSCENSEIDLGANVFKIVHVSDIGGPEFQGQKVKAKIISYNLTYTPKGMKNVFNQ